MLTTVEGLLIALVCLVADIAICAVVLAVRAGKPAPINVVSVPGTVQYPAAPAPAAYAAASAPSAPVRTAPPPPPTLRYGGEVKLNGVPDRVAAQLMAIVAEESGIPLKELRFISIAERS